MTAETQHWLARVRVLRESARAAGHRRLMVLAGSSRWCSDRARRLVESASTQQLVWLGDPPDGIHQVTHPEVSGLLGSETDLVVVDARCGLDPDDLAALAGTLRAGGLLVLLTPPLDDWPAQPEPALQRFCMDGQTLTGMGQRFIARLGEILRQDAGVCREEQGAAPGDWWLSPPASGSPASAELPVDCRTQDQAEAVAAVLQVVHGHRRRPLVLTADRGRGKSAALGIAVARLAAETASPPTVLLTAPSRAAAASVFRHAGKTPLQFVAPADLLADSPAAELLLVDEAAGIPLPMLEQLLQRYARIVFATTVHGYEGTGRGFDLRFRARLQARLPEARALHLQTPIRWAEGDPLEDFLFRSLLLTAEPDPVADGSGDSILIRALDQDALLEDPALLEQLFGLLVDAHYRTRPSDLRQLLDGQGLTLHVALLGRQLVGVVVVCDEGGFPPATADAIWLGRRRPRGHLLAQSLGAHCGVREGARLRSARIMRLAVHADMRRRGIGRQLVDAAREAAADRGRDCFGTSFGGTPELIAFWRQCGLRAVRVGLRADAASGSHSVVMADGLTAPGLGCMNTAEARFRDALPVQLAGPLRGLPAVLVIALLATFRPTRPDGEDWLDAAGFAFAERDEAVCLPALQRVLQYLLAVDAGAFGDAGRLMVQRLLQAADWPSLAREHGLAGRSGVVASLRRGFARALRQHAPAETLETLQQADSAE